MHTQNEQKETRESREKNEMKNNNITIKRRATRTFACEQVTADLFSTFYHNSWVKLQSKQQQKVNRIQISKAQMTSVNTTESKCRQEQSLLTIKHLVFALFVGFLLRSSEKPEQVWTKKKPTTQRNIFVCFSISNSIWCCFGWILSECSNIQTAICTVHHAFVLMEHQHFKTSIRPSCHFRQL